MGPASEAKAASNAEIGQATEFERSVNSETGLASTMRASSQDIAVIGAGMVSSLGHDVATSCATARAGMTRPSGFEYVVGNSDETMPEDLTVHAVYALTKGFSGDARLMRLVEAALGDLLEQFPLQPWAGARVGFFVSLPPAMRPRTGAPLIADPVERELFLEQAQAAPTVDDTQRAMKILTRAAQLSGWQGTPHLRKVFVSGTTATAEAMAEAMTELRMGNMEFAIVLSVDSWIDYETITWLDETHRLKTPEFPAGLQPGEACTALVLEQETRCRQRQAPVLARMDSIQVAQEERFLLSGKIPTGRTTAELLYRLGSAAGWSEESPPWVLTDHNGETYRATEWGNVLCHLGEHLPYFQDPITWVPALAFGDTGASYGGVAVCMALRAFARSYAPRTVAAITCSSDGPQRATMLVRQV